MKKGRRSGNRLRLFVQIGFVLLAVGMGVRHHTHPTCSFDQSCPFGGVETAWSVLRTGTPVRETGPSNLILLGVLIAAAALTGRAFCAWACPLGTVQEWMAKLARRWSGGRKAWLPVTVPERLDRILRLGKYVVLALVLWASTSAVVPVLMPFCPYRTLFTANLGSLLGWAVLLALLLTSLVVERFWCRYLCPLGAILVPFNKISLWRIRADESSCISCGICKRACPVDLDVVHEVERGGECIRCLECVHACPREGTLAK